MPTKVLYMNIYRSFFHTSQNLEATQISINRRSEKEIFIYSYNRILFCNKKKQIWYMQLHRWILKKQTILVKEARNQKHTLNDSIYIKLKNKRTSTVIENKSDWGPEELTGNRRKWRAFLGWWKCSIAWLGCILPLLIHALNSYALHSL